MWRLIAMQLKNPGPLYLLSPYYHTFILYPPLNKKCYDQSNNFAHGRLDYCLK